MFIKNTNERIYDKRVTAHVQELVIKVITIQLLNNKKQIANSTADHAQMRHKTSYFKQIMPSMA